MSRLKEVHVGAYVGCPNSPIRNFLKNGTCGHVEALREPQNIGTIIFDPQESPYAEGGYEDKKRDIIRAWEQSDCGTCSDNPFGESVELFGSTSLLNLSPWRDHVKTE